jgi:hypothetical protein
MAGGYPGIASLATAPDCLPKQVELPRWRLDRHLTITLALCSFGAKTRQKGNRAIFASPSHSTELMT